MVMQLGFTGGGDGDGSGGGGRKSGRRRHVSMTNMVLLCLVVLLSVVGMGEGIRFRDVSKRVGFKRRYGRRRRKFGGAAVADLDGDGWPDLIFGHHNDRHTDLYFNARNGRFIKSSWGIWNDTHGISPFRFAPWHHNMHFVLSRGGGNGNKPKAPSILRVDRHRQVLNVTRGSGVNRLLSRGRSAVFLNLRRGHYLYPHMIATNVPLKQRSKLLIHHAFEGRSDSYFRPRFIRGFARQLNSYATVADVNGDGFVELVSFSDLKIFRLVGNFRLRDVSRAVLPADLKLDGVVAVAELDFDNDGRWDLYVARTSTSDLKYVNGQVEDYLLRNVGGRYIDVTREVGIGSVVDSRGVTTGDFNNDGWMDILVTRYKKPDLLLVNRGDGTFRRRGAGFHRGGRTRGDMAVAVDYNRDGRLDVVLSEGDYFRAALGGYYRMMKNVGRFGNFLLIRVGNAPNKKTTSLHAVVQVRVGKLFMMRRVGSPGTAVSISYIELVHFGLGPYKRVDRVAVRWVNGARQVKYKLKSGSYHLFGKL